jgi:hypothetical protein
VSKREQILSRCSCPVDGQKMGIATHCPVHGDLARDMMKAEMVVERAARTGVICRECGCSEYDACEGGCSWAKPGLCSRCAGSQT